MTKRLLRSAIIVAALFPVLAAAQQPAQPMQPPQVAPQESATWANLPRMQLERQFAGPLQDTIVQRWRDPADGTICYIYLPITAQHSAPTQSGFVQYGGTTIGSISCFAAAEPARVAQPKGR
jgi:hypothetical protein